MSLVDDIYEAGNLDISIHPQDELGLAVWDNVEYFVARALAISQRDRKHPFSIDQLYRHQGKIYKGHQQIEETVENIYALTETTRRFSIPEKIMFWKILKECLPVLNQNFLQISDNLLWDKDKGGIINIKEELKGVGNN